MSYYEPTCDGPQHARSHSPLPDRLPWPRSACAARAARADRYPSTVYGWTGVRLLRGDRRAGVCRVLDVQYSTVQSAL